MEKGSDDLLMLSEYLERNRQAALARKSARGEALLGEEQVSTA
jgi:hypothetical protein